MPKIGNLLNTPTLPYNLAGLYESWFVDRSEAIKDLPEGVLKASRARHREEVYLYSKPLEISELKLAREIMKEVREMVEGL